MTNVTLYLAQAWPPWLMSVLTVGFIVACVFLVLTVLIQKPQGGGLSGAFGGGSGSGQTAFGTKTGDALTVFTIIVFCVFLVFAIVLNLGVKAAKGSGPSSTTTVKAPAGTSGSSSPAQQTSAPGDQTPASTEQAQPPADKPAESPATAPAETPASNPAPSPAPAPTTPPEEPKTQPTTPPTTPPGR